MVWYKNKQETYLYIVLCEIQIASMVSMQDFKTVCHGFQVAEINWTTARAARVWI
jgi:hypothetical protein